MIGKYKETKEVMQDTLVDWFGNVSNNELKWKDIVKVKNIEDFREPYGILVEIRKGKRKYIFPLCDLEIIDKQSKNHFITQAFLEWWTEKYW